MNYYKELQRIDIGRAINEMAEVTLPRGIKDKILSVHLLFEIEDFRSRKKHIPVTRKEITLIYHRPDNYMFVGVVHNKSNTNQFIATSSIEYLSCHDSCWRDEVERYLSTIASELADRYEQVEGLSIHTGFGLFGAEIILGNISVNRQDKTATFISSR